MAKTRITLALILTYMVFAVLLNSVGTVILQAIHSFGVTKNQASLLEAFKDLPIAVTSFFVAALLPRLGYRRAMMLGLGLVMAACIAMPLIPAFWMSKLLFLTIGVSFALAKIAVYSTIGLLTETPKQHASLTGLIEGLFMVGVLSGYWIFSAFIDPNDAASLSWLNVYWLLAGACAVTIALLVVSPLDESAAQHKGSSLKADLAAMPALLAQVFVIAFLASAFLYVLVEQSIGTWLPTFNNEVLKLPPAMSVQASSIFAAALAVGRLGGGALARRVPWHVLLSACVVAMGVLIVAVVPLAHAAPAGVSWLNAPAAAYLFPLIGALMAPIYPTINSAVLSALPKWRHASMTGLIVIFSALGGTFGSFITGRVFGHMGGQTAFLLALVPLALLLAALFVFKRLIDRHPVEA